MPRFFRVLGPASRTGTLLGNCPTGDVDLSTWCSMFRRASGPADDFDVPAAILLLQPRRRRLIKVVTAVLFSLIVAVAFTVWDSSSGLQRSVQKGAGPDEKHAPEIEVAQTAPANPKPSTLTEPPFIPPSVARTPPEQQAANRAPELEISARIPDEANVSPAPDLNAGAVDHPEQTQQPSGLSPTPDAPLDCLPPPLRAVLGDLEVRFGPVSIISTTHLHTANHSPGSARAKMHQACTAVDVRTAHEPNEVIAFLRSRPELGGVETYRNRVIHFDLNTAYRIGIAP